MARGLSLSLPLSALAASAALAGCGAGAVSATTSTPSHTDAGTSTSVTGSEREPVKGGQSVAKPLTLEEMREYDANEGRCHDDRGTIRDVGTVDAYCSFPTRSNDFHLIESSHEQEPAGEEE
ncbi:MAG: hypothetical protein WB998_05835 [Solirubrobacteraceae bacterium]